MSNERTIEELFDNLVRNKKPKKMAATPDPILQEARAVIKREKQKSKDKKGFKSGNGYDYVKVWNPEGTDYKYIPKARHVMAQIIGHEVPDHMRVFFRDGDLKGEAKYAPENLVLGFRAGVPLDLLTCKNCGCQGAWEINSIIGNGEKGGSE